MANCEECLHYPICEIMSDQYGISKVYPSQCGYFQNAADVAPKSEVAREIFAEIENTINNELQNNHKVLPQVEFSNEIWNRISGRINALQGIRDFIAELKKKYTGDQA